MKAAGLPILPFRDRILAPLRRAEPLVLTAPTGSGKSTQVPRFLLEDRASFPGNVLVLEPRRLAARSLAQRVACEAGARLGEEVGYQVRFDSRCSPSTAVVFQTYGIFVQQLLSDPWLTGVGAVLLDEFHERTLESDLALAWLKAARAGRRPDLKVGVMSATLDARGLTAFLPGARHVDVPGRLFPVSLRHLPPERRDRVEQGALQSLRLLGQEGFDGSALVFMPGMREIRRTVSLLRPFCQERGLDLWELHGSMDLAEQQKALDPGPRPRVIVSTNVAETSLTLPGVTMVIDSGLHRIAAYSPGRDINTLYLARISRSNAEQRAGRAGRTAPGRCVRLWSAAEDSSLPQAVLPEIQRLELSSLALKAASLPGELDWLTAPEPAAWEKALQTLRALGALDSAGGITDKGRALLRYPLAPRLAAVLEGSQSLGTSAFERVCAMAAIIETGADQRRGAAADLYQLSADVLSESSPELPWETQEACRQLRRLGRPAGKAGEAGAEAIADLWLEAYPDRLSARPEQGLVYRLADGRKALLPWTKGQPPRLLVALDIKETAGAGQAKQVSVSLYLPCDPEHIQKRYGEQCRWEEVSEFDEKRVRVLREERLMFRGLPIASRQLPADRAGRKADAGMWAEKLAAGELKLASLDEKVEQLVLRIRLARKLYPDYGFPEMGPDDWRLIYGELCEGKNTLQDIERAPLEPQIARYVGAMLMKFLDQALPARQRLPSGRTGRFLYAEARAPELSARLGDFLGMGATLSLCEGRLPVLFDILAPNHRTVQKTADLGSFWKNTYPAVKKELMRKYPKHPWP